MSPYKKTINTEFPYILIQSSWLHLLLIKQLKHQKKLIHQHHMGSLQGMSGSPENQWVQCMILAQTGCEDVVGENIEQEFVLRLFLRSSLYWAHRPILIGCGHDTDIPKEGGTRCVPGLRVYAHSHLIEHILFIFFTSSIGHYVHIWA